MKNFQIRIFEPKTLIWWYSKRNTIDMSPPYQRHGRIWSKTDKAYLIDTIINGYDIPKIYIADYSWGESQLNKKKLPLAIIDGKQRFEAIFDFFNGEIVLNDDFVYLNDTSLMLAGLGYKDLLKYTDVVDELHNYSLTVMSVYTSDEKIISELFVRLNRSKPLTGAEIRNAMAGPVPELTRQIAGHAFFKENIHFQTSRGQNLNAATKILLFEYSNGFKETTKPTLDEFAASLKNANREMLELSLRKVIDNLDSMNSIFLPNDSLLNSAGIIPVYYWLVREIDVDEFPKLREFINTFQKERTLNRKMIREEPNSPLIKMLTEYDNYNRSTNSELSHKERFRIMKTCFNSYLKSGRIT